MAMYVFAAISAISSLKQSQQQAEALRFQGDMALIQSQQKSLSYQREELNARKQANAVVDRLARANSAVIARAAAMNLMPFEGSPLDLQGYNNKQAGDEWIIAKDNAETMALGSKQSLQMGQLQRNQNYSAADSTESLGWLKAISSFGSTLYGGSNLGGPSIFSNLTSQAPAPVTTANVRFLNG